MVSIEEGGIPNTTNIGALELDKNVKSNVSGWLFLVLLGFSGASI
jgi:hypothetical protein